MSDQATTVKDQDPIVKDLLAENRVLRDWVVGILEGCEGCTDAAMKWAEGQIAMHSQEEGSV